MQDQPYPDSPPRSSASWTGSPPCSRSPGWTSPAPISASVTRWPTSGGRQAMAAGGWPSSARSTRASGPSGRKAASPRKAGSHETPPHWPAHRLPARTGRPASAWPYACAICWRPWPTPTLAALEWRAVAPVRQGGVRLPGGRGRCDGGDGGIKLLAAAPGGEGPRWLRSPGEPGGTRPGWRAEHVIGGSHCLQSKALLKLDANCRQKRAKHY